MTIKYLLATDGSRHSEATLSYAKEYLDPESASITVITVTEEVPGDLLHEGESFVTNPQSLREEITERTRSVAREYADELEEAGFETNTVTMVGDPGSNICEYADETDCNGIIMSRRGHGEVRELLLGSVSQYVVHHAPCPVTLVPSRDTD